MSYNLISCKGFSGSVGWFNFGDCMKAKFGAVILFFLLALLNKWFFGMMGIVFNFWLAAGGGLISYLIIVSLFGSFKIALGLAIVIGIVCGMLGGAAIGSTSEGE